MGKIMQELKAKINAISIVIPVNERGGDLVDVLKDYQSSLEKLDIEMEFIIVLSPKYTASAESLEAIKTEITQLKIIELNRSYGEAGEIAIGVEHSQYDYILTLPPYEQVDPSQLNEIMNEMGDNDVVAVNRFPRIDPITNKFQSMVFRGIFKMLAYNAPEDPGSGIRLCRREVFDDVKLYGDLHRFFLILAENSGFRTKSINIPQSKSEAYRRVYGLKTYLTRFLDILTVVFLTRFNKKPLRFFGAIGAVSSVIGALGLGFIAIQKLFFDIPAGDRPLLVLFCLFLVLGVQLIAIGLVGETIIFTSAKDNKEYRIRKIIN